MKRLKFWWERVHWVDFVCCMLPVVVILLYPSPVTVILGCTSIVYTMLVQSAGMVYYSTAVLLERQAYELQASINEYRMRELTARGDSAADAFMQQQRDQQESVSNED